MLAGQIQEGPSVRLIGAQFYSCATVLGVGNVSFTEVASYGFEFN